MKDLKVSFQGRWWICGWIWLLTVSVAAGQNVARVEAFTAYTVVGFGHGSLEMDSSGVKVLDFWMGRMAQAPDFPDGLALCFTGYSCEDELNLDPFLHLKRCKVVVDYLAGRVNGKVRMVMDPFPVVTQSLGAGKGCAEAGVDFRLVGE